VDLSVVIPTRDRRVALAETLDGLARQETGELRWEVVVVDNGSGDGTPVWARERAARHPVPLTVLEEPTPGPAAARNAGLRAARGAVVFFLGDDMAPAAIDLVAGHARLHAQRPEELYGVLGRATWRPDRPVTAFMHWLEHGGPQFRFASLPPGPVDPAAFLATPNVSLKTSLLRAVGGFDARFPHAAVEDVELGTRLADRGLILDFHPELLVLHDHPTTLAGSLARMHRIGRSGALLNAVHPGRAHPGAPVPSEGWRARALSAAVPVAAALVRPRLPGVLRRRAWDVLHADAYRVGYRAGPPSTTADP